MRAGALTRRPWDSKVHLEDLKEVVVPVPKPSRGQVLIKVAGSSINPVDWKLIASPLSLTWRYPHLLGMDCAGTVAALGEGSARLRVGDRVWAMNSETRSCFAEYAVLPEGAVGLAPTSIPLAEAGVLPLVALTGLEAYLFAEAPWTAGNKTVLVLGGSGGTGHAGVQLAKALGAGRVIATCGTSHVDFCKGMGADSVIDYHREDWHKVIPPRSVDIVYDTVAAKGTGDLAYDVLKDGGFFVTLLQQGLASLPTSLKRPSVKQHFFLTDASDYRNLDTLKALAEQGKLRGHIEQNFSTAQVAMAVNASMAGHTEEKISVVPSGVPAKGLPPQAASDVEEDRITFV